MNTAVLYARQVSSSVPYSCAYPRAATAARQSAGNVRRNVEGRYQFELILELILRYAIKYRASECQNQRSIARDIGVTHRPRHLDAVDLVWLLIPAHVDIVA